MIVPHASPPARPVVVTPGPRQVSFGRISGRVGPGIVRVVIRVDGRTRAARVPRKGRFSFSLRLPLRDVSLRVTAVSGNGRASSTVVRPVLGLPAAAAPRFAWSRRDPALSRTVGRLARRFHGTAAVYVEDLRTGVGAAWNARARFPAASTLKLAIAAAVLRALPGGPPAAGTPLAGLLNAMLIYSDNRAANSLLVYLGGSTAGGGALVTELVHALGLTDTEMYGGYLPEDAAKRPPPIPVSTTSQPSFGPGKYTTGWDLARLIHDVDLAAAGTGPFTTRFPSFTAADARYLLYELGHVQEPGRLGRFLGRGARVAHKAGWISTARHDNGIVFWRGGSFVATVMTWNPAGAGDSSDELAGRIALAGPAALRAYASAVTATRAGTEARRALFGALIDHAPLFPPASLPLEEALEDHRQALSSPECWLVARFVCPASRLADLKGEPLRLTVVVDGPGGLAHVDERVEAVEGRDPGLTVLGLETYVEMAPDADLEPIRRAGARAKVRCGPTAPPVDELASFVRRCRAAGVVFKATAGLHHALPTDGQHGFLNVLAAAVFGDEEEALAETDPEAFHLDSEFRWRDRAVSAAEVAEVRRSLFASIGSCSFSEPVEELKALALL